MTRRIGHKEVVVIAAGIKAGKTGTEIAKDIGFSKSAVFDAVRKYELGSWPSTKPKKVIPPEFAEYALTHSNEDCADRFGCGNELVRQWRREMGIANYQRLYSRTLPDNVAKVAAAAGIKQAARHFGVSQRRISAAVQPAAAPVEYVPREKDPEELVAAQSYLQRDGYRPVCRCNADGMPTQGGAFWICGRTRALTDAELIAKVVEIRERRERLWNARAA